MLDTTYCFLLPEYKKMYVDLYPSYLIRLLIKTVIQRSPGYRGDEECILDCTKQTVASSQLFAQRYQVHSAGLLHPANRCILLIFCKTLTLPSTFESEI